MSVPTLIEAVSAREPGFIAPGASAASLAYGTATPAGSAFAAWFQAEAGALNSVLARHDTQALQLASGETGNLHQMMIGLEEAKLAFQFAVQVRNRVLEAYQDVLRMQL
jgi:flagellar hook-basal body complex protein FliE